MQTWASLQTRWLFCKADALHLHDQRLDRLPDPAILEKARHEKRILLTHDLDFGELVAASGAKLPSVIIFRLRNMRPEQVNRCLQGIIIQHQDAIEEGAIISVTERHIRECVFSQSKHENKARRDPGYCSSIQSRKFFGWLGIETLC